MRLYDETSCFNEITAYFNSPSSGYPFVANIDDSATLHNIISKMQADSKTIIRVSEYCSEDDLPNVFKLTSDVKKLDNGIVLGYLLNDMFLGEQDLKTAVSKLLNLPVQGHVVVFIWGCGELLSSAVYADGNRAEHRTLILKNEHFIFPTIKTTVDYMTPKTVNGFSGLLSKLEDLSYDTEDANISVRTSISSDIYKKSMFQIIAIKSVYDELCNEYHELKSCTDKEWGSDKQWQFLSDKMAKSETLSNVMCDEFGSLNNLSMLIKNVIEDVESNRAWLLWIAMKIFGTRENKYLSNVVKKSNSVQNLIELIVTELLCYKHAEDGFLQLYNERKQLVRDLPNNNLALIQNYCNLVGKFDRDAVYYLTNLSQKERLTFLYYLGKPDYSYTEEEILGIVKYAFPEIYDYLGEFEFNDRNTKGDPALLDLLTQYFHDYKLQKVTNRIFPEFMEKVEEYAVSRPFTKLSPRITILKKEIDKSNAQIHFFDSLGVEFLAYILKKCDSLGLQAIVHIARCELPSITSENDDFKEFIKIKIDSDGNKIIPGTKDLDDLKHHSKKIDYKKTKEPIHLFTELEIIDNELRQIHEMLTNCEFEKIIIVSDHGASRLSVIHQSTSNMPALENRGIHSGRCCPVSEDPNLPEVAYENGYAVLANYDRFKGGRAANVEVHGGASLEETVIPIIEITKKPKELDVHIEDAKEPIQFHNKEVVSIIIFSNIVIRNPKIVVAGASGAICERNCSNVINASHYKFEISEIKRSGKFTVDLYDGNKLIKQGMVFETKKTVGTAKKLF